MVSYDMQMFRNLLAGRIRLWRREKILNPKSPNGWREGYDCGYLNALKGFLPRLREIRCQDN